jgi:hypothetical protein
VGKPDYIIMTVMVQSVERPRSPPLRRLSWTDEPDCPVSGELRQSHWLYGMWSFVSLELRHPACCLTGSEARRYLLRALLLVDSRSTPVAAVRALAQAGPAAAREFDVESRFKVKTGGVRHSGSAGTLRSSVRRRFGSSRRGEASAGFQFPLNHLQFG